MRKVIGDKLCGFKLKCIDLSVCMNYSYVFIFHDRSFLNSKFQTVTSILHAGVLLLITVTITIEFVFAGINMFWARLRLILAQAAINITLEGIEEIKT